MARVWEIPSFNRYEAQAVTLGAPASPAGGHQIANLVTRQGRYYVAQAVPGSGILVNRADFVRGRFVLGAGSGVIAASGTLDNPRMAEQPGGSVSLVYDTGASGSIVRLLTRDLGATWGDGGSMFTGTHPNEAVNPRTGNALLLGYDAGTGHMLGMRKRPGDRWFNDNHLGSSVGTSQDAAFVCVDNTGTPLAPADDGFGLDADPSGGFVLTFVPAAAGALIHAWSGDEGKTWSPWST